MTVIAATFFAFVLLNVALLLLAAAYNLHLVAAYRRTSGPDPEPVQRFADSALPRVTVQLPVYNEGRLADQVLRLAAALDYPHDKLDIQYLDDSDDGITSAIARETVAELRRSHPQITFQIVRRGSNESAKAGALRAGLPHATGEFIAIFDADFRIPQDFLRRTIHHFTDPQVGIVQTRWHFYNAAASLLTHLQAAKIDLHQMVEQGGRAQRGLIAIFHGTAGIWRRDTLVEVGGWVVETENEDVESSIKAALKSWRLVYLNRYGVPSELPESMVGFVRQQMRWRRGSARISRVMTKRIWRASLDRRRKLDLLGRVTLIWGTLAGFVITVTALPVFWAAEALGLTYVAIGLYWTLLCMSLVTRHVEDRALSEYPEPRPDFPLPLLLRYVPLGYLIVTMGTMWAMIQATAGGFRESETWEVTPKAETTEGSVGHGINTGAKPVPLFVWGTLGTAAFGAALATLSLVDLKVLPTLFYGMLCVGSGIVGIDLLNFYRPFLRRPLLAPAAGAAPARHEAATAAAPVGATVMRP